MRKKSTITNDEVLNYIKQNEPVTYRELQDFFSVGSSVIFDRVEKLREGELLQKSSGKAGIKTVGYLSNAELRMMVSKLQVQLRKCREVSWPEPF